MARQILGRGIDAVKRHYIVERSMIVCLIQKRFEAVEVAELAHEPSRIKVFAFQNQHDNVVMTVRIFAGRIMVAQKVRGAKVEFFLDGKHGFT